MSQNVFDQFDADQKAPEKTTEGNAFDQFDEPASDQGGGGNAFDQFDQAPANDTQPDANLAQSFGLEVPNALQDEAAPAASSADPEDDGSVLTDFGNLLAMGADRAALNTREAVRQTFGDDVVGAIDSADEWLNGKKSEDLLSDRVERNESQLTDATKDAREKAWWDSDKGKLGPAWSDWRSYAAGMTESLPETAVTMAPSMALSKGVYAWNMARGVGAKVAAKRAATTATLAGGLSEGALGGAASSREVGEKIRQMPEEVLRKSHAIRALMSESDISFQEAREQLADDASSQAFVTSAAITGAFGGLGDRALAKIITGGPTSRLGGAARGAVSEGLLEEMPQEAGQQYAENSAIGRADESVNALDNVPNAALGGLAIGAGMGAGMGAAAGGKKPNAETDTETSGAAQDPSQNAEAQEENSPTVDVSEIDPEESARLIRTPRHELSSSQREKRDSLIYGDTFKSLRAQAESRGDERTVAELDELSNEAGELLETETLARNRGESVDPVRDQLDSTAQRFASAVEQMQQDSESPRKGEQGATYEYNGGKEAWRKAWQEQGVENPEQGLDDSTININASRDPAKALDQAVGKTDINPTSGQAEAGNYRKAKVRLNGLEIAIENPKGSTRRGTDADGNEWENRMGGHYGDIKGTEGADGDNLDVFVGSNPTSSRIYVVDQVDDDGAFDETKTLMGYDSLEDARKAYLSSYDEGWQGLGEITETTMGDFRQWVREGNTRAPFAMPQESASAPTESTQGEDQGNQSSEPGESAQSRRETTYLPDNTPVDTEFRVVDLADLTPSNRADGQVNPDFPAELQPRDRTNTNSQVQVSNIAARLNPERLGSSPDAGTGAPIVGRDGVVESGNGRTMAIANAYKQGGKRAQEYRDYVQQQAQDRGVSANMDGMRRPVLVRERSNDMDRAEFARRSNESQVAGMTSYEQAMADADAMTSDDLTAWSPSQSGDPLAASNRDFQRSFVSRLGNNEAARYTTRRGQAAPELGQRMSRAVFAKAYNAPDMVEMVTEQGDQMRNLAGALQTAAPDFAMSRETGNQEAVETIETVNEAVRLVRTSRREGVSISELTEQTDAFSEPVSPMASDLAMLMNTNMRSRATLESALAYVAGDTRRRAETALNGALFEDTTTSEDAIREGFKQNADIENGAPGSAEADVSGRAGESAGEPAAGREAGDTQGAPEAQAVTLQPDGTPFQTKRAAELSRAYRDTPGAAAVEVEGGWGFTAPTEEGAPLLENYTEQADTPAPQPKSSRSRIQKRTRAALNDANPGDLITFAADTGYAKADTPYRLMEYTPSGEARIENVDTGGRTTLSQAEIGNVEVRAESTSQDDMQSALFYQYPEGFLYILRDPEAPRWQSEHGQAAADGEVGRITGDEQRVRLIIRNSGVHKGYQGSGRATDAYADLADRAHQQGKSLTSDVEVTPAAARIYERLEERGYQVERSPTARLENVDGEQKWVTDRGPVFTVPAVAQDANAEAPALELETQTEESRQAKEQEIERANQTEAEQARQEAERAQADKDADDFLLTGSDRTADVAAARGQEDIFSAPPAEQEAAPRQTETPAFQRWFGDSVVTNEDGSPKVMYHGTVDDFAEFQASKQSGGLLFFAGDADTASAYALGERSGYANMDKAEDRIGLKILAKDNKEYFDGKRLLPTDDREALSRLLFDSSVAEVERIGERFDDREISADQAIAEYNEFSMSLGGTGSVMPVYLKAESPINTPEKPMPWKQAEKIGAQGLRDQGHDSVYINEADTVALAVTDPRQIKSAFNHGSYSPDTADIRYAFAGESAQGADQYALDTAKKRIEAGEDAESVRQETGWFQGADKRWRFEISDDDAAFLPFADGSAGELWTKPLDEVLDHPKLFAAYPGLRNIDVLSAGGMGSRAGQYRPSDNEILLNSERDPMSQFSTLLHELQHGIQHIEGFAQGGSPDTVAATLRANILKRAKDRGDEQLLNDYRQYSREFSSHAQAKNIVDMRNVTQAKQVMASSQWFEHRDDIVSTFGDPPKRGRDRLQYAQQAGARIANILEQNADIKTRETLAKYSLQRDDDPAARNQENRRLLNNAYRRAERRFNRIDKDHLRSAWADKNEANQLDDVSEREARGLYRRLYGEAESRNVQARQGMTDAERQATPVSETQDIADSDAIVVMNGQRVSSSSVDTAGVSSSDIATAIEGAPELSDATVIQSHRDLPPEILAGMASQGVNPRDVRGMYADGELYVIADNVDSVQEGVRTAVHEAVGHKGMRAVLGEELEPVMRQLYNRLPHSKEGRAARDEVLRDYPFLDRNNPDDQVTIAEEMVAHLAEKGHRPNAWQRVVAKIKELLRKLFPGVSWTTTDALDLGEKSRQHLRQEAERRDTGGERFAMAEDTSSRNFKRWFGESKLKDDSGQPITLYHQTSAKAASSIMSGSFDLSKPGARASDDRVPDGVFLKSSSQDIGLGAARSEDQAQIPLYAAIENPLRLDSIEDLVSFVRSDREYRRLSKESEDTDNRLAAEADRLMDEQDALPRGQANRSPSEQERYEAISAKLDDFFENGNIELEDAAAKARNRMTDFLKESGYDGVWVRSDKGSLGRSTDTIIAFDPSQVKSASDNKGTYDPGNPEIRYNLRPRRWNEYADEDSTGFGMPDERLRDAALRKMADKMRPLKTLQYEIKRSGRDIEEEADTYLAEELFHGKVEYDIRQLQEQYVEPLADGMAKSKITQAELDEYLYARHAPERNATIAERNPDDPTMQDGGSGMTNAKAARIIQRVANSGKQAEYDRLANLVYGMTRLRRDAIRDGGLEDGDMVDAWESTWQHYVPLKGSAKDEPGRPSTGKGFEINGSESRIAGGRSSLADSPSSQVIVDANESLIRRRKNEVGQALLSLVTDHPNPSLWQVFTDDNPDTQRGPMRVTDPETGKPKIEVREKPVNMSGNQDYFKTKRAGRTYYIKMNDERLMNAMRNVGPENNGVLIRSASAITRVMSSMMTSFNPEFMLTNFTRDVQTALLNLTAEQTRDDGKIRGEKIVSQTARDTGPAMKSAFRGMRGKQGRRRGQQEWDQWFREFQQDGAKTGYFDMKDINAQAKEIRSMVRRADGTTLSHMLRARKKTADLVENLNSAVENGVRLSAYTNARREGVSRKQAASLAKNMTVNFNRRGEAGTALNAAYMFANASIQGSMNFARTMVTVKDAPDGKSSMNVWSRMNTAQKIATGMATGAFMLGMLNRWASDEDDDGVLFYDKVPDYEKERNIVLMSSLWGGDPEDYIKIPLPYGYNVFSVVGTHAEAVMAGTQDPSEAATGLGLAILGSFSPIGWEDSQSADGLIAKNLTPTIARSVVQVGYNEDFAGRMIYKEDFPFGTPTPDSSRSMRSTPEAYKSFAGFLNKLTGGTDNIDGAVDVSPDVMQHLVNYYGGGAWGFVEKSGDYAKRKASGEEVERYRTPFAGRFASSASPYQDQSLFYDRMDELGQVVNEADSLRGKEALDFRQDNMRKIRLFNQGTNMRQQLTDLRKRIDRAQESDALSDEAKERRVELIEKQMKRRVDDFNRRYDDIEEGQ